MSREELINNTIEKLKQLSDNRLQEVSDYVSFLTAKIDDKIISEGIKSLASNSKSYEFLHDEDELYQVSDVKRKIPMKKEIFVLLSFPFTDLKGEKVRPALILMVSEMDVIVAFITTQFKWQNQFDLQLEANKINGLKKTSLLRLSKITTLDKDLILGKLGELDSMNIQLINNNLIKLLNL